MLTQVYYSVVVSIATEEEAIINVVLTENSVELKFKSSIKPANLAAAMLFLHNRLVSSGIVSR